MRFSERAPWSSVSNALADAAEQRRSRGASVLDLTVSNPTRVGVKYPEAELRDALRDAAATLYEPSPLGSGEAREAVASHLSTPGDRVNPDDIVITASTSEAYSFLFKVFCNPGDEVLTHAPAYPLLEYLAALEGISLSRFPLRFAGDRWSCIEDDIKVAIGASTRLIAVIHPNNPTGSYLSRGEQDSLFRICGDRFGLISDEVFFDYPHVSDGERAPSAASRSEALSFSLQGLSKSAGLPHWKLGWIRIGGPSELRKQARTALELTGDAFLSVSTPIQTALPTILGLAPRIQDQIRTRLRDNLETLNQFASGSPLDVLPNEGGWSAVVQVDRAVNDEMLAVALVKDEGVLVHPGYLYDFGPGSFLVVSLLTETDVFEEGVKRILGRVGG